MDNLKRFLEGESARLKNRTPEQRQVDRESYVPGIFIGREEIEEFREMSPDEQEEKLEEFNLRLAESNLVGPPHRMIVDEY